MYVNPLHRLTDRETLFALVAAHPLGAWVCNGRAGQVLPTRY
jgi:predicted FMN-binding regulatory protein PaiB